MRSESVDISSLTKRVRAALKEDLGPGDITSKAVFSKDHCSRGVLISKGRGIIAGLRIAGFVCQCVDQHIEFRPFAKDGDRVRPNQKIALISGKTRSILAAERTLLNFLQRLSGIATLTAQFAEKVMRTHAQILDTRKTTPLWRDLEKYAVRTGGGKNHRMGLYDAVLIKDNHIACAGSIWAAVSILKREKKKHFIEVETKNFAEVKEAYFAGVDRIMFDNMRIPEMQRAVKWLRAQKPPVPQTEASGGINLSNIAAVARTGVDFISAGALTHSAPALDINLLIKWRPHPANCGMVPS